ncbi:hypothetical protein F4861DRAFT_540978 [Xylaria intraflava]|nr:hypothetical protein F4861DRAFT_540978 [Xylaria intraflava]
MSDYGEAVVAQAITSTCDDGPLMLVNGLIKGSEMISIFQRTYAASNKIHKQVVWDVLNAHRYDGKDPIDFSSKWLMLARRCREAGWTWSDTDLVDMFISSVKEKAYNWNRSIEVLREIKPYTLQEIIDHFNHEFHSRVGKKSTAPKDNNNSNVKNRAFNGSKTTQDRSNKGSKSKKRGVKCFKCRERGHIAKDCPQNDGKSSPNGTGTESKSGQSNQAHAVNHDFDQPPPAGIDALATHPVAVDDAAFIELMKKHEQEMMQRGYTTFRKWEQDGQLLAKEEVIEEHHSTHDSPEVAPSTTYHLISLESFSMSADKTRILFDTGSTVDITNDDQDFVPGMIQDLTKGKAVLIRTGNGNVQATKAGHVVHQLRGVNGERNELRVSFVLYIKDFPIKIVSGHRHYLRDGYIDHNVLVGSNGRPIAEFNPSRRSFFLWPYGEPEPALSYQ